MKINLIALRYARALASQVGKENGPECLQQFERMLEIFAIPAAKRILLSPAMPKQLKSELLNYALDQAEVSKEIRGLVRVMQEAQRIDLLPDVAVAYSQELNAIAGILSVRLHSAVEFSAAELEQLSQRLAELKGISTSKVEIQQHEDKQLLAGFVLYIGNLRIDMSLRSQLQELLAPTESFSLGK